ncbi:hypothetical protein ABZX39_33690 [Streptomyces collinus]|uniref:hypothetical protein n=1 Tax=Streptomyces collinus TaxID=42684 RepID=UPI0033AB6154
MPTPKPARILTAVTAAIIAVITLLLAGTTSAHAATTSPVYKGTGWKAETADGIYSLSPDPYTVVFADSTARSKLAKYFIAPAAQVTSSVGVPITVTTTLDTSPATSCPSRHRIVVHYAYRPMGTKGMSQAHPCYALADGSAWGGHLFMDSEYWTSSTWFSTNATTNEARRKDAVTHELGHILGLAHPNYDKDKDGVVENGECVRNSAGLRPLMCSPNRSNPPVAEGGKFTREFDIPGLRQMLANYYLRQT